MFMEGFVRNIQPIEFLTPDEIGMIHSEALDVLWQVGVRFEHDKALRLLKKEGCWVDFSTKQVRIPEFLVEECLGRCPSSVFVKSRNPKKSLRIGGNRLYISSSCGMNSVDLRT